MICSLCKREVECLEFHHFYPGRKRRENNDGIYVCEQCGDQIHLLFDNSVLRNELNTLEKLKNNQKFKTYLRWIENKPADKKITIKTKKRKR